MYDEKDGIKRGVLNDFDLARLSGSGPRPTGRDRTGTMPFMALDLLTKEGINGQLERLYRHDAESFAWSLMYIFIRIDHPTGTPVEDKQSLRSWLVTDYEQCQAHKIAFCSNLSKYQSTNSYKQYWNAATGLITFWIDRHNEADKAKLALQNYEEQSQARKGTSSSAGGPKRGRARRGGFLGGLAKVLEAQPVIAPAAPAPPVEAPPKSVLSDLMTHMRKHGHDTQVMLRA
jgi:hypothetical protein